MFGGGSSPANKEFGSSNANTTFGAYERGRYGGLDPEWMPFAILGVVALVVVLVLTRK